MFFYQSKTFLQLTFEAICTPYGTGYAYKGVDWEQQFTLATDSHLCALLLPTIERLAIEEGISSDLVEKWRGQAEEEINKAKKQKAQLELFLARTSQEQLPFLFMKGCVLADCYPDSIYRSSNDTDIFVDIEEGMDLLHFLEKNGYEKDMLCSKGEVPVYVHKDNGHRIEIHYSLWEEYTGPKISVLDSFQLTEPETVSQVSILGHTVSTLGPTQHLFYLLYHTIKHIIVESTHFRQLVDIYLFIKKYDAEIDYPLLWKQLEAVGYSKFAETLFQCCITLMYLQSPCMDGRNHVDTTAISALLEEFAKHTFRAFPEGYWEVVCEFFKPYVDGSDQSNSPEDHLKELSIFKDPTAAILVEDRIASLHKLHLTSKEKSLPPLGPVDPHLYYSAQERLEAIAKAPYFYTAYGLSIASELAMPELTLCKDKTPENIDVYIRWSPSPKALGHPNVKIPKPTHFWFHTTNSRFLCLNGNEIIAEAKRPDTPVENIKPYIISHGLVNILYMRGQISLHSSTVGNEKGAITIVGDCGAGKSTYSTLLRHQGYALLADDVSTIFLKDGKPFVQLSVPQQKYTVDTAQKEGFSLSELEHIDTTRNKYRLRLSQKDMCDGPRPMVGLFELIADYEENRLEFVKLEGMEAMRLLVANLFCQYIADNLGGLSVDCFTQILAIAKEIPIYRIYRPTDRDARQEILEFMLKTAETSQKDS